MNSFMAYFGFTKTPFPQNLNVKNLLKTDQLLAVAERVKYSVELGAIAILTGEIGTGKSSALRYAMSSFHPSEYHILFVTATTGSVIEAYKQICSAFKIEVTSCSKSFLIAQIKSAVLGSFSKRQKVVLVIDEASLLRLDVFKELHTLTQFDQEDWSLPMILAGQNSLIDALQFQPSRSFASRVVARSKLEPLKSAEVEQYLLHHLTLAGVTKNLYTDQAITAIHKLSSGMLRKMNHIARGSLIAAAHQKAQLVLPEHVQVASSGCLILCHLVALS